MSKENIKKKLHKLEEAEIQRNKMTDKAARPAKHLMHSESKCMLADPQKGMKEQMT
jgi:hypothetical protein